MPPAARVGDQTGHLGAITGPGVATVLIGGQPAAVLGDSHACASGSHPPTIIDKGSSTVFIGGRPAARLGDTAACGSPIVSGAPNVNIGG